MLKNLTTKGTKMSDEKEPIDNVLADVAIERLAQDKKWGGPKHDDEHGIEDFCSFANNKLWKAVMASHDENDEEARKRLIQVAALAVAAVESLDRKVNHI